MLSNPKILQMQDEHHAEVRRLERESESISHPCLVEILKCDDPGDKDHLVASLDALESSIRSGELAVDERELLLFFGRMLLQHHGGQWGVMTGPEKDGEPTLMAGVFAAGGTSFDPVSVWAEYLLNDRTAPPLRLLMGFH
ncbi:hypothetical protein AALF15_12140 [Corynebacteriaceae bacterium 7-707]